MNCNTSSLRSKLLRLVGSSVEARLIIGRLRVLFVLVKQSQHLFEGVVLVALPHSVDRVHGFRMNFFNSIQSTLIKSGLICPATKNHIKESNRFVRKEFSGVFVIILLFLSFRVSIGHCFICGSSWLPVIYSLIRFFESFSRLRQLFKHFGEDFVAVDELALEIFGDAWSSST
jgi:hypothetical protein